MIMLYQCVAAKTNIDDHEPVHVMSRVKGLGYARTVNILVIPRPIIVIRYEHELDADEANTARDGTFQVRSKRWDPMTRRMLAP